MSADLSGLRASQIGLLRRVKAGDVTWNSNVSGRVGYRLWSSEREYVLVTGPMKRLNDLGFLKLWHNPSNFGRGGVELTEAGKRVLASDECALCSKLGRTACICRMYE